MRCNAYECNNNEGGYCGCPDYVVIDEYGKCTEYWEPVREGEPDE